MSHEQDVWKPDRELLLQLLKGSVDGAMSQSVAMLCDPPFFTGFHELLLSLWSRVTS